MPNVEVTQQRHDLRSDEKQRRATEAYFKEGTANSQSSRGRWYGAR